MQAWLLLLLAGLFEIGWAVGIKYSDGFTKPWPTTLTITAMVISMVLLSDAAKTLPIGTAYAVWTGIGAAGAAILGLVLFAEPATLQRLACIGLIIAGVIGLKLATPA